MNDFRRIAFGYTSAEAERSRDPGLLTEGYIDFKAASEEVVDGKKFLFLGYKGAGKSSIAERARLTLADSHSHFVKLISLADFPFTPFSKIVRGDAEPETKYPTAWSWILLIYLLESLATDEAVAHHDMVALQDTISAFRQMGLSPVAEIGSIVRTSAKNNFKLALPGKLAEYSWSGSEVRPASEIPDFVESLKELISGVRSDSKHILIVDGLDDILTSREIQYKSLSALVFEVGRLNLSFERQNVPAKIVLLCRTDLFERIPGANKNKIRHDSAVELDWYHDPRDPDQSRLVQIANLRTTRSLGPRVKLFEDFFPSSIDSREVRLSLLDMTRHTPRDFLRLLSHIQEFAVEGKLSAAAIKSGMREYSIKYFLPEIQDELSGYVTPEEISRIVSAFARLRKRDFRLSDLISLTTNSVKPLSAEKTYDIVEALFQCSAVGNIQHRPGGTTHYTFKYRNRHSSFNENEDIMLHRGLWKALNIM
ncbi:P-loop ATPase, Sll1717 family [Microvirga arabica]|uniref:P-loop ATPase, Sll1717 family n=1 Tax=Microvirga arabica TaxID=1128671 RepID=A0ABV6YH45_9HYPH